MANNNLKSGDMVYCDFDGLLGQRFQTVQLLNQRRDCKNVWKCKDIYTEVVTNINKCYMKFICTPINLSSNSP